MRNEWLMSLILGLTLAWNCGCGVVDDSIEPRPAIEVDDSTAEQLPADGPTDGSLVEPISIQPDVLPPASELGGVPPPPDEVVDESDSGDPGSATPLAIPPPQVRVAPTNLEAFRNGFSFPSQQRFGLRWVAAQGQSSYVIERRTRIQGFPVGDFQDVAEVAGTATTADVVMNASVFVQVEFRVRAVNQFGSQRESNIASVSGSQTFPVGFAFPAPTNLTATGVAVGSLRLDWVDNHHNEPNSIEYQVEQRVSNNFVVIAALPPNFTSYTITGLSGFRTFRVRSVPKAAAAGSFTASQYSNEITAAAPAFAPGLAQPTNLRATAVSGSEISLQWTDNANNELRYIISMGTSGANMSDVGTAFGAPRFVTPPTTVATFRATGLLPNTQYFFHVRARNLNGDSPRTSIESATTLAPATAPAAPTQFAATALSSSVIQLVWRDNASNEEEFVIDRSTDGGQSFVEFFSADSGVFNRSPADANLIIVSDEDLAANTEFCYRVRTRNSAGTSAPSNSGCATTLAATATAVRVTNQTAYPVQSLLINNAEQLPGSLILLPGGFLTLPVSSGSVSVRAQTSRFTAQGETPMYNFNTAVSVASGNTAEIALTNPALDGLLTGFTNAPRTWEALLVVGDLISVFSCTFHPVAAGQTLGQYQYFIDGVEVESGTYSLVSYPGNGNVTLRLDTSGTLGVLLEVPDATGHRHILMAGLDFED